MFVGLLQISVSLDGFVYLKFYVLGFAGNRKQEYHLRVIMVRMFFLYKFDSGTSAEKLTILTSFVYLVVSGIL